MGKHWRLILDGSGGAAFNMAVDEAIMRSHGDGGCPLTLRLYGWARPAVSVGYSQLLRPAQLDREYCRKQDVEIVRRLTGGRAVAHGHDLTFSVVAAETSIPGEYKGVLGSHRWIMGAVAAGLAGIGINARVGDEKSRTLSTRSADCFAYAANCDLVADGCKIAGAAQVRKRGMLLEQGSIPFGEPLIDLSRLFMEEAYGGSVSPMPPGLNRAALEAGIVRGFEDALGIAFEHGGLSQSELRDAQELETTKYASETWTFWRSSLQVTGHDC